MSPQKRSINPAFAMAAAGLMLAACSPTTSDTPSMNSSSSAPAMMPASSAGMMQSSQAAATSQKYTDGTYAAVGSYVSPAGAEKVDITLTIKGDVITAATFKGEATHPTSKRMQDNFGAGYETLVVGKSVDSVSLSVVNGSSLAPKGFMDALAKIKAEASA